MIKRLVGKAYFLRRFSVDDITEEYIGWLNDPDVTRYLEIRFHKQTRETATAYINSFYSNVEKYLWGIYTSADHQHIGTVSLYDVNYYHRWAEIGLMIGNRNHWGQTASLEALRLIINFAFSELQLHRLCVGTYSVNAAMNFTLNRLRFVHEGTIRDAACITPGNYVNTFRWGLLNEDWEDK